ncbi:hypothetical protein LX73_1357 [Fodinibius salinus]|uniref:Uncharacterized protein n=1 Tax=Fodinibius salinus TaxID=860790 RepID=A0A5D3YJF9_9BACT|nr:hypothetical protein [Fodinibius salinus]TYP93648.1 hypothetical protein LX73_1357 [Fodinibius salinus]
MYENVDPQNCNPPGTFLTKLPHPANSNRSVEKAVIMEHRFAFFFWMKWRNQLQDIQSDQQAPTLVTIDWHRDFAPPTDKQKKSLLQLDQSNLSDVSNYVWARFAQTNDAHIRCATWLNLVGDVILLKNTAEEMHQTIMDHEGREHTFYEFGDFERFQNFILDREDQHIFFDIDLDYFIHGKGKRHYSEDFSRYTDEEIKTVIDPQQPVFQHILPKCEGITLAQEPGYCGGMLNSAHIMTVIYEQLFAANGDWPQLQN